MTADAATQNAPQRSSGSPLAVQYVTKRDGTKQPYDPAQINEAVERACDGLDEVSPSEIILDANLQLYEGVTTKEIDQAMVQSARSKIEKEPEYAYAAARILMYVIYKEVFGESVKYGEIHTQYALHFKRNLESLVDSGMVSPKLLEFDLEKIAKAIQPERDRKFKYLGLQTVYDRYLQHINKRRMETPQAFFMRVAMGLAINEDNKEDRAIEFYNVLSQFHAMSSTPTLFNAGTNHAQLSSCFLNIFDDSIDGIFDGLWQEARKSKFSGGLGYDLTTLRARGSYIKGTNGENQGAVFFWKLFNDLLVAVNQGGKRRGAGCGYLETWHADIEDFLSLRRNTGDERVRTHDMNTANWIPDLFIKQVLTDGKWYLFSPNEVPELHDSFGEAFEEKYWDYVKRGERGELRVFKEVNAKDLWKKMLRAIFETGHPWVTFKDPSNVRYSLQHEGVVHSSNLCTEIIEHTKPSQYKDGKKVKVGETAVCNLASVNLRAHLKDDGEMDWDKLGATVKTTMRMLDNVIDINFYPTEEARNSNLKHRFVGLGSMGWQDVFYAQGINYESKEAIALSDKIYEFISYHAIEGSAELADERGAFKTYEGSLWDQGKFPIDTYNEFMKSRAEFGDNIGVEYETMDWKPVREKVKSFGMRNALTMAIAPTATISYIVGCSQSTEPNFSTLFVYSTLSGEFTMVNEYFVNDMKERGLWDSDMVKLIKHVDGDVSQLDDSIIPPELKDKYKTAFALDYKSIINCAAARQKWLDQAASLNLYNTSTSLKHLNDIYIYAFKKGLKTTYYLRNQAASKVEKSTVDGKEIEKIIAGKVAQTDGMNNPVPANPDNDISCVGCQ